MTHRFTQQVQTALNHARHHAIRLDSPRVQPEHVLLALLADAEIQGMFARAGADPEHLRERIESTSPPSPVSTSRRVIEYSRPAKRVLEFAMDSAKDRRAEVITTLDLFLGVLKEGKSQGFRVLQEVGLTQARVQRLLSEGANMPHTAFTVVLDDSSASSIYEQIVAQITEAIATGSLEPWDRLPAVRRLADELDIAPGTVARAYSEMERQGLLITEGARGTRVARGRRTQPAAERRDTVSGLLRPVAVAAYHLGATADEVRDALDEAMVGIFEGPPEGEMSRSSK